MGSYDSRSTRLRAQPSTSAAASNTEANETENETMSTPELTTLLQMIRTQELNAQSQRTTESASDATRGNPTDQPPANSQPRPASVPGMHIKIGVTEGKFMTPLVTAYIRASYTQCNACLFSSVYNTK